MATQFCTFILAPSGVTSDDITARAEAGDTVYEGSLVSLSISSPK